jgi:hypothetical protein
MPNRVDFLGEHPDHVQEGLDLRLLDLGCQVDCPKCGSDLVVRGGERCLTGVSLAEFADSLIQTLESGREFCEDLVLRWRHTVDANRSGGERQASR